MRFIPILLSATAASAAVIGRQQNSTAGSAKILIGNSGTVSIAEYDGKSFSVVAKNTDASSAPSWMAFKQPNLIYTVDENANATALLKFDTASNSLEVVTTANGNAGVVSLAFNKDQTRLVGASYGTGGIDIWDVSSPTELKLLKQLQSSDPLGPNADRGQSGNRAHQAILDPSGRFFAVNDLGSDRVLIIDAQDDAYTISNSNVVPNSGCGPRHGVWYPPKADKATHYIVVCEILNTVEVFKAAYTETGIELTHAQGLSTFGAAFPPVNASTAAAGEIIVSSNAKDIYVSNRLTGNETDSLAHFKVKQVAAAGGSPCKAATGGIELEFAHAVSSGGLIPRHFSLSKDEKTLFVGNQDGPSTIVAFARGEDGVLNPAAVASLQTATPGENTGPQFVEQII
ncbi:putative 6-phosphogluconolactonase [Colletotrichum trifolii]|uniref:Putative 6-phosphogluconolactonase n=1 Tax=Colletotrichum trifolii TaxID=5466 RepID=A0A4R8QEP6_COLTR|nr:putative 6-phosphogluconolactonase [Colletotrichum trifolii]